MHLLHLVLLQLEALKVDSIQIGKIKIYWLRGGYTHFDGGAMFGVVPKPLWEKNIPQMTKIN